MNTLRDKGYDESLAIAKTITKSNRYRRPAFQGRKSR